MIAGGYLLQMEPRTDLVAESMFDGAYHGLASQPIAWVRSTHCEIMELLRKCQSRSVSTVRAVIEIKALEGAQLILRVAKVLCNLERPRERRAHLGSLGCRCAQRGVQSHFVARVLGPSSFESAK